MARERLRDLGIRAGRFDPGPANAITDVTGVTVGHLDVSAPGLRTGITAVAPHPVHAGRQRLFLGRWILDGGGELSGLPVAEDFGTFSSPIVFAPAPAFGRIYDGLISQGHRRDRGLPIDAGWPPVVVGVDDGLVNDRALERGIGERELDLCFAGLGAVVEEGSRGIGRGLCAFGLRGGVGTASRRLPEATVGLLVAANGGERRGLTVDGAPVGSLLDLPEPDANRPRSTWAIVATDAPLLSGQLDRLAGRTALGLARGGFLDGYVREGGVLAFSTRNRLVDEGAAVQEVVAAAEDSLFDLFEAAAEAAIEAGLNALLATEPAEGLACLTPERLRTALDRARR